MNIQIQDIKKILRIITIILISSTLLTPFIFSSELFFPYITGKAFFMRLMIILSSISYIGLIAIDKNSRPKKSYLLYSVIGFVFILILATLNSENPTRSMWSNFERMEGLVTMLYLSALFVIASSTIKLREWKYVMNLSIICSIAIGIHALSSAETSADRIAGFLGNSTYLGVYSLIHIFFGFLGAAMIFRGNREAELLTNTDHKKYLKLNTVNYINIVLYVFVILFNAFVLFKTGTRGAFVGLLGGLILSAIFLAWKEKNKIIRFASLGFLVAILLSVSFLGIFKNSDIVKNSNQLSRFAGLITLDLKSVLEKQGEARVMVWGMAYEGFKERPLLGWGQDNFGYVFAKYYNPGMYAQEQWFDRSHNVFMDWLVAGGILGLLGYLSLFVFAFYFIFSKKTNFTIIEKSIWIGLLTAYFIHNIFVFDNLSSYILFFFILAYINDRYTHDRNEKNNIENFSNEDKNKFILIIILSTIVLSFVAYQTILKPYTQNKKLISILRYSNNINFLNQIDTEFKNVLNLGSTGKFESFEQLSNALPKIISEENVSTETKQNLFQLYIDTVKDYDTKIANDSRYNYFVANTFKNIGDKDNALLYINKAYDLSPKKQTFAYNKALILLDFGRIDEVVNILKEAYENDTNNIAAFGYYTGLMFERLKINKFNNIELNIFANVLAEGYREKGHDIIFRKELWEMFTDNNTKQNFENILLKLLPEEKEKIKNISKK